MAGCGLATLDGPSSAATLGCSMKYIHYTGRPTLTVHGFGDVVIEYADVLGASGQIDTVDVLTFVEDGQAAVETLLIGPGGQIAISSAYEDEDEFEDDRESPSAPQ